MPRYKPIAGGVIAAAVTPRQQREPSIDLGATLELIDFLSEGGADGIALLTSNGEFVHFTLEDRARALSLAVKRSRVPVIVNISHSTCDGALWLGEEAAGCGVAALLLMAPCYYRYSENMVRAFYLYVAEELAREAPLYLLSDPAHASPLSPETANELLATGLFAGVAGSSGDWTSLEALLAARGARRYHIFSGPDGLAARAHAAGADGALSEAAAAIPELIAALLRAVASGDANKAQTLDARLQEFLGGLAPFPMPYGIKEAARQRGVPTGPGATPLDAGTRRDLAAFGVWFKNWLPGVLKECR